MPLSAKQPKSKKQTYQELLQRLESKSKDSHKIDVSFAKTKHHHHQQIDLNGLTSKQKTQLKREPFSNVSVSKILDKYNQLKIKTVKRDDHCKTEY
jgi:hypothetical protein